MDLVHAQWRAANLPEQGIPRLDRVEDKPWGMREFALLDLDGNLLKVGRDRHSREEPPIARQHPRHHRALEFMRFMTQDGGRASGATESPAGMLPATTARMVTGLATLSLTPGTT